MGATGYSVYVKKQGLQPAFDAAVAEAQHESGHGGYTGTIAEKAGYGCVLVTQDPLPLSAARTFADRLMEWDENNEDEDHTYQYADKWGPANAIPVALDSAFRIKHKTLYLQLGTDPAWLNPVKLAGEHIKGKTICDVQVLEDKKRTRVKKASGGKRTTKYAVLDRHNHVVAREDSLAAAKAKATELCGSDAGSSDGYFVKGEIFADGGGPLFGCVKEQTGRKVKIKVTYVDEVRRTPAACGYLFFGTASD